jgi:tetratricopeptide (TPR) repeat protein
VRLDFLTCQTSALIRRVLTRTFLSFRKSEIAFKYAQGLSRSGERSVFWIRANTWANIKLGYSKIARLMVPPLENSEEDVFSAVKNYLEHPETPPYLLVLDEADDKTLFWGKTEGFQLIKHIPRSRQGQVLITSRDSRLASSSVLHQKNCLKIKPMSFKDGLSLFKNYMPDDFNWSAPENCCERFLEMLGGLPLAIVQASSYIRAVQISVEDFVSLYGEIEQHDRLFQESVLDVDAEQKSVLCTWEINYRQIAGSSTLESKSQAAMLLDMNGFIDSQSSQLRMTLSEGSYAFRDTVGFSPIQGLEDQFERQQPPLNLLSNIFKRQFKPNKDIDLNEVIGSLCTYSLVTSRQCWVHPVVHSWISRRRLDPEEREKYLTWLAVELSQQIYQANIDSSDRWEDYLLPLSTNVLVQDELAPLRHAEAVLRRATEVVTTASGGPNLPVAELFYQIGSIKAAMGKRKEAISYLDTALKSMDGIDDPIRLSERRLHLARVRSPEIPASTAISEARCCAEEFPSVAATLWLSQCLHRGRVLEEALSLTEGIMAMPEFFEKKEVFAAQVGAVYILSDMDDPDSKVRVRGIIDGNIAPYIRRLPLFHMLKTILYPEILVLRVHASDDQQDVALASHNVVKHYTSTYSGVSMTGGQPQEWYQLIDALQQKGKWSAIKALGEAFVLKIRSIPELVGLRIKEKNNLEQLELINEGINAWCNIYNCLGKAFFELGHYEKAELAHWTALGLWLGLFTNTLDEEEGFQSNIWNLYQALLMQGSRKEEGRLNIRNHFYSRLEMEEILRAGP